MTIRTLIILSILFYGAMIPVFASNFALENSIAAMAMVGACALLAALLWCGRADALNLIVIFYVLKVYLTRPYVDIFFERLNDGQQEHISGNNFFFNSNDAVVVYVSLVSLLAAWLLGLIVFKPRIYKTIQPRKIFSWVDAIVLQGGWRIYFVWALLKALNYRSPSEAWQGHISSESSPLFAFGLAGTTLIEYVFLFTFLRNLNTRLRPPSKLLLTPLLFTLIVSVMHGSRSFAFTVVFLSLLYWAFLNLNRRVSWSHLKLILAFFVFSPLVLLSALFAQQLRPLLRAGAAPNVLWDAASRSLDLFGSSSPILQQSYFHVSDLLHRLSSLQATFLVLTDNYYHLPTKYINLVETFKRVVNDLVPGEVFNGLLSINQLYNFVYRGDYVRYNSETWGIQSTLYIYFGFIMSPVIVFLLGAFISRKSQAIEKAISQSPAFAVFLFSLTLSVVEFGTVERLVAMDLVRALSSLLIFVIAVVMLRPSTYQK
jgi:hypothetical protein